MRQSTLTGRIVFADQRAGAAMRPATLRVNASPRNPEEFSPFAGGPGRVNEDFTFEIKARPARVVLRVNASTGGWTLKAVRLNGADVTDSGIEVKPGEDMSGLEIELTNRITEVSGVVTNARNEPVKDYSLIVFSSDREHWGPGSRFVRHRTAGSGRPLQDHRIAGGIVLRGRSRLHRSSRRCDGSGVAGAAERQGSDVLVERGRDEDAGPEAGNIAGLKPAPQKEEVARPFRAAIPLEVIAFPEQHVFAAQR
jgi:hypothetical protein